MSHQTSSTNQKGKARAGPESEIPAAHPDPSQASPDILRYFAATAKSSSEYISPYASTSVSQGTSASSATSSPGSQLHGLPTSGNMSASRSLSANEKAQLIRSLQTHKVNTLTELRRIERIFASVNATDTTEALTNAWAHYVNSNNLLSELRALTKNYPFSSECLDEAKYQVIGDPASTRSFNFCWLILTKIRKEGLIARHARLLAAKPVMWGGRTPTAAGVEKLATACVAEWTRALDQMLRNWTSPPSLTGR